MLNGLRKNRRLWSDFLVSDKPPIGATRILEVIARLLGKEFNPEIQRRKGPQRWAYALRKVDELLASMAKFLKAAASRGVPFGNWRSAKNLYDASVSSDTGVESDSLHTRHYVRLVQDLELWVECVFLFRHAQAF